MSVDRENPRERVAEHHRHGRGTHRVGYPIGIRRVRVRSVEDVTPRMRRLTLGGPGLEGFHSYQADDHVRIVFPDPDGTQRDPVPNDRQMLDWPDPFPRSRKYTVRRFDPDTLEIDLDFVLHEGGLAAEWVRDVAVGQEVSIAGPPGAVTFPHHHDHFLFAVDVTAVPALARWLDEAPTDVSAQVFIDHDHPEEKAYPLADRPGVSITWLDRGDGSRLAEAVNEAVVPSGSTMLFAAGESQDIKPLRRWGKEHCTDVLVTGYWRRGVADLDD